jgi:hypothetical protein
VTNTDGQWQDVAARALARRGGVAPVVIPLTAAFAFGAIDQYLQVAIPISSHPSAYQFVVQVSNGMSAPWLLVPFLAGAWQAGRLRAALVGLVATWLSVLAYVLMIVSPMEGVHLTPRALAFSLASQWPWFAGGLITGLLFGWLGHRWRARQSPAAALLVALPVLLEPGARWLATGLGLGNISWIPFQWPLDGGGVTAEFTELAVGLLLTCAAIRVVVRDRASARA